MTKFIDASLLSQMIICGANNLSNNRELVDSLNVFPVPDGDTGTNMSLTFINASRSVESITSSDVSEVMNTVAKATLRGARGNSGVILSQIFRGISKAISSSDKIDVPTFIKALRNGSDTAYRAVMKPTEGTILTVIRAAAETAEGYEGDDICELLKSVYEGMNKALLSTTEILPQLKQAGVVDAGGQGLLFIFEGFLSALSGETIELSDASQSLQSASQSPAQSTINTEDIKFAYCTEFIINKYNPQTSAAKMRAAIESKGDCMIVIDEDDIVKVHIHTNHPGFVLEQAVKLGEMVNIKIENMREQHTDLLESSKKEEKVSLPHKETAVVAVCNGNGLETTFRELGVTTIIHGGQTMNPSTEDILSAIEEANADNVFVLPNNKNIVLAAQQAAQIADTNVIVIESTTIPQGICAMMAFSLQSSKEENTSKMQKALKTVTSGSVTHAVKDTELDGMEIHEGNIIGVASGHIVSVSEDISSATVNLVKEIADEDSEIITLYYGEDETEESAQKIADSIEELFPDADILVANGGQSVYYYIVSVE